MIEECQSAANHQAPYDRKSIELHRVPGPLGNEKSQQQPTKPTHTST